MPKSVRVVYPGSFDPITLGHLDIIQRLAPMYDEFTVLVANARAKTYLFTAPERAELVKASLASIPNVKVDVYDGLTADYARNHGIKIIIRGLRAVSDFENEFAMANMNKTLYPDLETLTAFTHPQFSHIASRMVKEVAYFGGDVRSMVPEFVADALEKKTRRL